MNITVEDQDIAITKLNKIAESPNFIKSHPITQMMINNFKQDFSLIKDQNSLQYINEIYKIFFGDTNESL